METFVLVGDKQKTFKKAAARLEEAGVGVRINEELDQGALMVLTLQPDGGDVRKTLGMLKKAEGKRIRPLAILLLGVDPGWDPEMLEMIEMETRGMLHAVLAEETAEAVPLVHDAMDDWVERLLQRARGGVPEETLSQVKKQVLKRLGLKHLM